MSEKSTNFAAEKIWPMSAKEINRMIFASSCVESAARARMISTAQMYARMKRVGLISGFILPGYEAMHTQSRQHVTEDVLGALQIWEQKLGVTA